MYIIQERQLRLRRVRMSFMLLPPILRLESIQNILTLSGFILLTIGLLTGFAGVQTLHQKISGVDVKFIWSLIVWSMYLLFILARFYWRMHSRWLAWASIAGCIFVLSTFWLANAFSHFHRY